MSGCIGCTQAIIQSQADDKKTYTEAIALAKEKDKTYGLYRDGFGKLQIIPAESAAGYPITHYVSPAMRNPYV